MKEFYIWSNEHNSWWGINHRGYTGNLELAGLYTGEEAIKICNGANYDWDTDRRNKIPNEMPIHYSIAKHLKGKEQPNDR